MILLSLAVRCYSIGVNRPPGELSSRVWHKTTPWFNWIEFNTFVVIGLLSIGVTDHSWTSYITFSWKIRTIENYYWNWILGWITDGFWPHLSLKVLLYLGWTKGGALGGDDLGACLENFCVVLPFLFIENGGDILTENTDCKYILGIILNFPDGGRVDG